MPYDRAGADTDPTNPAAAEWYWDRIRGADAAFELYRDDGKSYGYEHGEFKVMQLRWDDAAKKLTHSGAELADGAKLTVIEQKRLLVC